MAQWCVALALLWPMLRNDRRAAFLLAGALMSLIPACSSASVNERSLFFIAFGGIGLAALALEAAAKGVTWLDGHRVRRVLVSTGALAVVLLHAAHPLWMLVRSHINGLQYSTSIKTNARAIDVDNSDFGAGKNIIVVNTGETFGFVTHAFPHRAYKKIALPQGMGLLTGTYHNVRITRTDSSTLVFNTPGGTLYPLRQLPEQDIRFWPNIDNYYIGIFLNAAFRVLERPMHVGDSVDCRWFEAVVEEVEARGVPSKAMFRFDHPLDDTCFAWVWWDWKTCAYYPFVPPPVGQTIVVPGRFSTVECNGHDTLVMQRD
jgi:hypothetical protein